MGFRKLGNYRIFLFSNSVLAFAMGLFSPFWIIFIQDFNKSIEKFGFSIGLMLLAQSITSYFVGKYSDKLGRRIFLIIGGFASGVVIFAYTLITSVIQLYFIQVIDGIITSIQNTMETTYLGDITKKVKRGTDIGKYRAVVGIMAAFAMMGGGFIVGRLGFKIIFYITSIFVLISTLILFNVKER